ncbi:7tm Chemosensory receptor [Popillia japonica]|uniref:7tm Chemosensory receptor n=1 Tax=Popillia japonica TaxID=7064 RepID=A0AAW1KSB8_POPJA
MPIGIFVTGTTRIHNEVHTLQRTSYTIFIKSNFIVKREINRLMLQMLHVKFQTTAANFFDINMKMIFSIISVVVQYAIILIQAQHLKI